jgi:hypothetical protein
LHCEEPSTEPDVSLPDKVLWLEVLAVLAFAWLPDVYYALGAFFRPEGYVQQSMTLFHISLMVRAVQVSVPILYLIWRSGEPWSRFGLVKPKWVVDLLLGLLVCFADWFALTVSWLVAPYSEETGA